MKKQPQKSLFQRPIFWVLAGAAVIAAATMQGGESGKSSGKRPVAKKPTSKSRAGSVVFTEADTKATFATIDAPLKNSFVPAVSRGTGLRNGVSTANLIPTDFTGGSEGWVFTGTVEVGGVRQALLENRATGEGVFLRKGERFKSCVVNSIQADGLVMSGPSGTKTFGLVDEAPARMAGNASSGFNPMAVNVPRNLRGSIGGGNDFGGGQTFSSLPMVVPSGGGFSGGGPGGGGGFPAAPAPQGDGGVVIIGE